MMQKTDLQLNKKGKLLEGGAQDDAKGQKKDGGMSWLYIWCKKGDFYHLDKKGRTRLERWGENHDASKGDSHYLDQME